MIYLIMASDTCGGDESWVTGYFTKKEDAEKYAELESQLCEGYTYWVNYIECLDGINLDRVVKPYYSYYVGKELPETLEQLLSWNYWETTEWLKERGLLDGLTEVEANDHTLNEYGNPSHKKCIEYILSNLSDDEKAQLEDYLNTPEMRWDNAEDTENRYYDEDIHIEEDDLSIIVYSINSFNEAKEKALDLYNQWLKKER